MIRVEQTIVGLWELLKAGSPEGARARRRAAATSAMSAAILAFFVAVGMVAIVVVVLALIASALCLSALAMLLQRHGAQLRRRGGEIAHGGRGVARAGIARSTRTASRLALLVRSAGGRTAVAGSSLLAATTKTAVEARGAARSLRLPPFSSTHLNRRRDAVRANALGVQLRREGDFAGAALHHRFALAVFGGLGDRRAEALTLNNLALALEHGGDPHALELFEQAATILGELGDEEHEGQVIANLALAFRRRGQNQESDEALETALGKLDPRSNAYRKAERLRRAS